jgi:tetratricopeptide (TPR) repeat protein
MPELDDDVYAKILELSELANSRMDDGGYIAALRYFQEALGLLPQPQHVWDAYTWLKAGVADALFSLEDYESSAAELFDAMNGPDGAFNPFILLWLGQSLHEQNRPNAIDYLCKAYILEGGKIFSEEDGKYLALVKANLGILS